MIPLIFRFGLCAAMMASVFLIPFSSDAEQAAPLKVASALICKNVANREAVEAGTSFAVSVGKLYCFSNIIDVPNSTEIVHAWYFGETQRAQISLGVNPPAWRTYSSKIIQAHEIGAWRVDIHDGSGTLLETVRFEITQ